MKYGLVFFENDSLFLGKYTENLTIEKFEEITDFKEIYSDLKPNEFSFVEIDEKGDTFWIKDLSVIEIEHNEIDDVTIGNFLYSIDFPSDIANKQFMNFYLQANKVKLN